jgi:REP element-mobilizing transposase RayT
MPNELPNRKHLKRIPVWIPDNQSVIYFVTACCADRRKIFTTDQPVKIALESLIKCAAATQWDIPQICFMPNHIHLMMCPALDRDQKLSKIMQRWKSSSKQRLNRADIKGDIWQHEFFDRLLRSGESLTDKWRYVEMNPVRAGLCSTPKEYPYLGIPEQILTRIENCRAGTVDEGDLPAADRSTPTHYNSTSTDP